MPSQVCVSSEVDWKTGFVNWWQKLGLKNAVGHLGLLVTLMLYTVMGGLVFRWFEYPAEMQRLTHLNTTVHKSRKNLVETIVNNSDLSNLGTLVSLELRYHERAIQEAVLGGLFEPLDANGVSDVSPGEAKTWTILKAVFFSTTVLTTIGYGNIVPVTLGGRVFCICFALIGIPLTLTVIADWGRIFASAVSGLMKRLPPAPSFCKNFASKGRRSSYAFGAVCFLFVYLAAGASLFVLWEDDWSFFDGFYFCFITMTTIGFGDLVPKKPKYMLLCTLYILVGLALTSTIIELVRRQYAQSWRRLQAMNISGPLAETLRRMAENAPGLDMSLFQHDIRRVLTVVSMPNKKALSAIGNEKETPAEIEKEWEETMEAVIRDITAGATSKQPVLQIVIYESSV